MSCKRTIAPTAELVCRVDNTRCPVRAAALAHWCEGFLHGLVSGAHGDALKERLGSEPLADIIKDMLQITRAAADDESDDEDADPFSVRQRVWFDGDVNLFESFVVDEYERGGVTAQEKERIDKALDAIQRRHPPE